MKNIHIIPTDKPSRLSILNSGKLDFGPEIMSSSNSKPQHIYITSDEEIKEGDFVVQINFEKTNTQVIKCETEFQTKIANSKNGSFSKNKIILTTDQDLIKNGVKAIDDEFLQWFVKNPSCEEIKVEWLGTYTFGVVGYKIIIPKEESKQMKQTAVDWMFAQLWDIPKDKFTWQSILKEAKQREKMQIERANLHGASATLLHKFELGKYYKETYGEDENIQ